MTYTKHYDKNIVFFLYLLGRAYIPFLLFLCYAMNAADSGFSDFRFGISGFGARFHSLFQSYGVVLVGYIITEYLSFKKYSLEKGADTIPEMKFLTRHFLYILFTAAIMVACAGLVYLTFMTGIHIPRVYLLSAMLFSIANDYYALKRGSLYNLHPSAIK